MPNIKAKIEEAAKGLPQCNNCAEYINQTEYDMNHGYCAGCRQYISGKVDIHTSAKLYAISKDSDFYTVMDIHDAFTAGANLLLPDYERMQEILRYIFEVDEQGKVKYKGVTVSKPLSMMETIKDLL